MNNINYTADVNQPTSNMNPTNGEQLVVTEGSKITFYTMAKWMSFMGIVLMIAGVLIILGGIATLSSGGGGVGLLYIIVSALPIFLGYLLFNSAKSYKTVADSNDSFALDEAVSKQKMYFIILGVLNILSIALVVIGIIGFIAGDALR